MAAAGKKSPPRKRSPRKKAAGKTAARTPAADPTPWLDHYPSGVSWQHEMTPESLPAMFDEAVSRDGDRVCTDFLGAEMTYDEMASRTGTPRIKELMAMV